MKVYRVLSMHTRTYKRPRQHARSIAAGKPMGKQQPARTAKIPGSDSVFYRTYPCVTGNGTSCEEGGSPGPPAHMPTQGIARSSSLPKILHGPYSVSLRADAERSEEEARVRKRAEEKQRRREEKLREQMRQQVVQAALQEARALPQPLETVAMLEDQKRLRALGSVERAADRHAMVRSDLRRRFYEPTPAQRERRDIEFESRRSEHQRQRTELRSQLQLIDGARSALLAASSEARLFRANERRADSLSRVASHTVRR